MASRILNVRRAMLSSATALAGTAFCLSPIIAAPMLRQRGRRAVAACASFALVVQPLLTMTPTAARAATFIWTGAGPDSNWSNATNWISGTVPVAGANIVLTPAGNAPSIEDQPAGVGGFGSITFESNAAGYLVTVGVPALGFGVESPGGVTVASNTSATFTGNALALFGAPGSAVFFTVNSGASLTFRNSVIDGASNAPELAKEGGGTLTLSGANTYSSGTKIDSGTLIVTNATGLGTGSATVASGSILNINGVTVANSLILNGSGIGNSGALTGTGSAGVSGPVELSSDATIGVANAADSLTVSGAISDSGSGHNLTKVGAGTLVLSGANTYRGATTVSAGTLEVDGSIANLASVVVNAGGVLTGTGAINTPAVTINSGATFAPGNVATPGASMTITGDLVFQPGATYLVSLNHTTSTFANVTGAATLAGTVDAVFQPGSSITKTYTILQSGGLGGTQFAGLVTTNLPSGFSADLSYVGNAVDLSLSANLGKTTLGLAPNQNNVINAVNTFFNNGGALPPNFLSLFGLSGGSLQTALNQMDGEAATVAEKGVFDMTTQFLGLMLDPYVEGRSGMGGGAMGSGAMGFAPEQDASLPPDAALAYAKALKAPAYKAAPIYEQPWTVWGAGFGGTNKTNGDPVVGSNDVTARDFGFAGGADYHASRDTLLGFALAGGGTNWGLAQGLGGGRSDAFQAGVYGKTYWGPAYVGAALTYAEHWMQTDRFAFAGDELTASFNAQSYGGRLEAGYRYAVAPMFGVTPYGALQTQWFHAPSYSETDATGGGFGLTYNSMTANDTRSGLGARFDAGSMLGAMPLILRARAAWAHDWVTNPALTALFQSLPGASFVVNGAAPPKDSALASAGAELHVSRNWTATAKFDGEFASRAQTYAGTGTLRYSW